MTDEKLWYQLKSGDSRALKAIYQQHATMLLRYGHHFCSDKGLVEDCVHDLFVYIWQRRAHLGNTDSIKAYLMLALRRRIVKEVQKSIKNQGISSAGKEVFQVTLAIEEDIIAEELNLENQDRLQNAFKALSARQKEAIYLRYFKEMDYKEIASIMEINYQSVRNLIFNGLANLRKIMVFVAVVIFL